MLLRLFVLFFIFIAGCTHIKPYEKEYLLSPMMEDDFLKCNFPSGDMPSPYEHLGSVQGGGGGSACPTCGG